MRPLVIYSYILQHFSILLARRDILSMMLSCKFPGKLLCITLFFTSCHRYNIVVYFTKKIPFRVMSTKNFRRIQWQNMLRIVSECISYNLEFQNFLGDYPRTPHLPETGETPLSGSPSLAPATLGSCLWHSTLPLLYKLRLLFQFLLRTLLCFRLNIKQLISNKNQEVSGKLHHKINL